MSNDDVWRKAFMPHNDKSTHISIDRPLSVQDVEDIRGSFPTAAPNDPVDHPKHYTYYQGLEIIDLTEQMNFNKGNAVKYIARAGIKNPDTEIEDLQKAMWYCAREIERIRKRP